MATKFHKKACDRYSVVDAVGTLPPPPSVAGTRFPASLRVAGMLTAASFFGELPRE